MKEKFEFTVLAILLLLLIGVAACERGTRLTIGGGNPPKFSMTGSGILTAVRVRGPRKQREAEGENQFLYWVIEIKDEAHLKNVEQMGPLTYGKMPPGFQQVYPERGEAPPLVEGERYYVHVVTSNANGDMKYLTIRDGKVEVSDY